MTGREDEVLEINEMAMAALGSPWVPWARGPPGQSLGSTISNDGALGDAPSRSAGSLGGRPPGDVRLVSVSSSPCPSQRRRETSQITFISSTSTTTGIVQFNATGILSRGPRNRRVQFSDQPILQEAL